MEKDTRMKVIVSTPRTGGLEIANIARDSDSRRKPYKFIRKSEYKTPSDGRQSYVQKSIAFKLRGHQFIALGRKGGIVQLFSYISSKFELIKEWKGAAINEDDPIISLDFSNGHLYSGSNDGKVVIRDINDDDSETSYIVNYLRSPLSTIAVHPDNNWVIASAGKNNELELNELNLTNQQQSNVFNPLYMSGLSRRNTIINFETNLYASPQRKLKPFWKARTKAADCLYNIENEVFSNWINHIIFLDNNAVMRDEVPQGLPHEGDYKLACSTRFGNILLYETSRSRLPMKNITVSNYPIISISKIPNNPNFLLFADCCEKIGILDLANGKVVSQYKIPTGPMSSMELITPSEDVFGSNVGLFSMLPMTIIVSSFDEKLTYYKLFHNNKHDILCQTKIDSMVPSICVVDKFANDFDTISSSESSVNSDSVKNIHKLDESELMDSESVSFKRPKLGI